jgi:hypothetical protein
MEQLPKIVRERLRAGQAGEHPDPDLLAAFTENSLSQAERLPILEHLSRCADCREAVMLASNAAESEAAAATPPAIAPEQVRLQPWLRMPVVRWAALAACVGLATALVIRQEWKQTTPAETNLAANHDRNRAAQPPLSTQAAKESAQNLAKAQSPEAGSAERAKASPTLSASATPPAAKQHATSSASRSSSAGLKEREMASSASKAAPATGIIGGVAGSAGGVPGKQAMPAMAEAVEGSAASPPSSAGQSQNARRIETETASDALTSSNFQQKAAAARSAPSAGAQQEIFGVWPGPNPPQWRLSSDGVLERSADLGKTWTKVDVGNGSHFRALSATILDVWAGGADGLLYHSSDGGAHWTRIHPVANGIALTSTITRIDFTGTQHGRLTTDTGETWITTDAGRTWQKR